MSDALQELAVKYAVRGRGRPMCCKCGERNVDARIVLQVKNAVGKNQKILAGRMRGMCGDCAAETFESLVAQLPKEGAK